MNDREGVEILLVEDSDADAEMALRALRKGKVPAKVLRVRDGVEALEFLFGGAQPRSPAMGPKLVLLDLKMPRVGGIEVLRRIKSEEATRAIPVVIFTSSAEEQDVRDSYRLGANSFLVKPVDFPTFSEVIREAGSYWTQANRLPH
ncbi:MAG: response regulator [Gammaproteobacteria bacterium]|nr:response regulator [Gammaproteobacteria bacterium]